MTITRHDKYSETPTPEPTALPSELREKVDALIYAHAAMESGEGTIAQKDAARASLDAALLALVQDAERLDWCENAVSAITVCDEHGDETDVRCEMSRADQTFREFLDAARHTPGGQDNG